jgi:hypothetical protein
MHEFQLALAVLPEPPKLFGLRLRPYSLGHELHLYRRNNPFIAGTFAEFEKLAPGRKFAAALQCTHVLHQGFEANCKPICGLRWWTFLSQFHNLQKASDTLRRYILSSHEGFRAELPSRSGDGMSIRFLGAPELLRLYQFISDTIPERELALYQCGKRLTAWDYPMQLATLHWQCRAELDGRLQIYTAQQQAADDEIARREALKAKEAEEKEKGQNA